MSEPVVQTFLSITPEKWQKITDALTAKGLSIQGYNGELKFMGVDAIYQYDGNAMQLVIQVQSSPLFITKQHAMHIIADQIAEVG